MSLQTEIQGILDSHGRLDADLVVQVATPEDSPLHERFVWDDAVAGHKFRLNQARQLIRSVRVVFKESDGIHPPQHFRVYSSLPLNGNERTYVRTEDALNDPFQRQILLRQMRREMASLHQKYAHMQEWASLLDEFHQQNEAAG
jgi:hypothetical protein